MTIRFATRLLLPLVPPIPLPNQFTYAPGDPWTAILSSSCLHWNVPLDAFFQRQLKCVPNTADLIVTFGFSLVRNFRVNIFYFGNHFVWRRITDEGSLPEMRIWSILLIKSELKWCIHLSKVSFYIYVPHFTH